MSMLKKFCASCNLAPVCHKKTTTSIECPDYEEVDFQCDDVSEQDIVFNIAVDTLGDLRYVASMEINGTRHAVYADDLASALMLLLKIMEGVINEVYNSR